VFKITSRVPYKTVLKGINIYLLLASQSFLHSPSPEKKRVINKLILFHIHAD
jgi:hypothetical protein